MRFSNKGFTLSELLLSAAILVFVLTSLLVLFINCTFLNASNRNLTIATTHAQYVMEEIKNTDFDDILNNINNLNWDWDSQEITDNGLSALTNESIDTSVSGTDRLDIIVAVSWQDRQGRARSMSLRTLIAEQ